MSLWIVLVGLMAGLSVGCTGEMSESPGSDAAVMECTPSCGAAACGSDGCGGRCGSCGAGEACTEGQCRIVSGDGCPPPGPYGAEPGDTATNVTLYDCDGNPVELHSLCGRRVSLVYSFAEWCPLCRDTVRDKIQPGHAENAATGDLATWVVLSETSNGEPVDASQCVRIREQYEIDTPGVTMLYDPEKQLNTVLGMRVNAAAMVMKRRNEVVLNVPALWSTVQRSLTRAFEETSP